MARIAEFTQVQGPRSGFDYRAKGRWKLLLHSTETPRGTGERLAQIHQSSPHFWADPGPRETYQVIDTDKAAYALKNLSGGVETNAEHVLQIEIVDYHYNIPNWSDADLRWLATEVIAPILRTRPEIDASNWANFCVPTECGVWAQTSAEARFQGQAWLDFCGVCGHQHAPENIHVDPGGLDEGRLRHYVLEALNGTAPAPQPPAPKPPPGNILDQVIRRGSSVEAVKAVQGQLAFWGLYPSNEIDGDYGPKTEAAVRQLQTNVGVASDGIWGPKTHAAFKAAIAALANAQPPKPKSHYRHYDGAVLTTKLRKTKRNDVAEVQFLLNLNNGSDHAHWVNVDGLFGPATSAEVQRFQKIYNIFWEPSIDQDGMFGPKTAAALEKILVKKGIWS